MSFAHLLWEKARKLNRLPGAYAAYQALMRLRFRDGEIVTLKHGPAAGLKWRHRNIYQPWMAMELYEPHVANLIVELLKPGDVFFDVGSNAGYFSLIAARCVGPNGGVVAFDPQPVNAESTREQFRLNGFDSIGIVEQLAICDVKGTLTFVVPERNANGHLVSAGAAYLSNEGTRLEVPTISLDEYVTTGRMPSLIKMDIEGAEEKAMLGARKMLSSTDAPVLLISTHGDELDRAVKALLLGHGYRFENLQGFEQMIFALPPGQQNR